MDCTDLREKRLAQCPALRMMRSPPTSYCVAMAAQKSAFPQVRAWRCRDAIFMAEQSPAMFMRQSENSSPNLRVSPVNERHGLQKHSSTPDEARLPLTSRYRHYAKRLASTIGRLGAALRSRGWSGNASLPLSTQRRPRSFAHTHWSRDSAMKRSIRLNCRTSEESRRTDP